MDFTAKRTHLFWILSPSLGKNEALNKFYSLLRLYIGALGFQLATSLMLSKAWYFCVTEDVKDDNSNTLLRVNEESLFRIMLIFWTVNLLDFPPMITRVFGLGCTLHYPFPSCLPTWVFSALWRNIQVRNST